MVSGTYNEDSVYWSGPTTFDRPMVAFFGSPSLVTLDEFVGCFQSASYICVYIVKPVKQQNEFIPEKQWQKSISPDEISAVIDYQSNYEQGTIAFHAVA